VKPYKFLCSILWKVLDIKIIDGLGANGSAQSISFFARIGSAIQTGYLYDYAFVMLCGVIMFIAFALFGGF
jgi:NADH-quinone oxidoreductase subunit L